MTGFQLKLIAITSMLIDHIGLFFFPQLLIFRMLGRLAFPLFGWSIANGAHHTKNMQAYLKRLAMFACISQLPFLLINWKLSPKFWELNVLFTLFLGLAAIAFIKKHTNKFVQIVSIGVCALAANLLQTDYGAAGVFSIVAFYLSFGNLKKTIAYQFVLMSIFYIIPVVSQTPYIPKIPPIYLIEPLGLVSLVFISLYTGQPGVKAKYLFYWFYPLHLFILYFFKIFL